MRRSVLVLLVVVALVAACKPYVVPASPVAAPAVTVVNAREAQVWFPAPARAKWPWNQPPRTPGDPRARYMWQLWVAPGDAPGAGLTLWAMDSRRERPDSVPLATVLRETHLELVSGAGMTGANSVRVTRPEVRDANGLVFVRIRQDAAFRALFAARPDSARLSFIDRDDPALNRVINVPIHYPQ